MIQSASRRDIVLVVDDSPETLSLLTDALEEAGLTVLVATDGAAALRLVEQITPDVILMDAIMPGMDGFETCRQLKDMAALAHVPVIFMTGLSETEHIVKGLDVGGVDYVAKPVAPDEIIARMRVHLANARQAHSARTALDVAGRFLMSADLNGLILWSTPQAAQLLVTAGLPSGEGARLPLAVRAWLANSKDVARQGDDAAMQTHSADGTPQLKFSYVGQVGPQELLLRVAEAKPARSDEELLRTAFNLTSREAEVLLWLARGKANRDIADILGLSPRTVNKHLEQVYSKVGVENRASATASAVRILTKN
ncbi:MAG: response regulator [Xanthobacter sp.]